MLWVTRRLDSAGAIPAMLSVNDPREAVEQLDEGYAHGGGWRDWRDDNPWELDLRSELLESVLRYDGDEWLKCVAETRLRDERVLVFELSLVAVVSGSGEWRLCRMD